MTLKEIKIKVLSKDLTMKELAETLGVSREYMYRCIKKNHEIIIEKIKKILE
ncbi:hypothetical protein [Fusobacterium sp. IOR10]|uniref:hypothetical protein n=1 Tax=Fusobacterium sp. IOR10 TaxID=2665157 RepID=UPI0013D85D13|nr:hypothetical protein [Fusobacterium sp. IOR10]